LNKHAQVAKQVLEATETGNDAFPLQVHGLYQPFTKSSWYSKGRSHSSRLNL
jgi:hypothetical protein